MRFAFEYRKLADFAYNVLSNPDDIRAYLMKWIMREWEIDHNEAPDEHWTVAWMQALPQMTFALKVIRMDELRPNADLMRVSGFRRSLEERAGEREQSMLRGVSIEPLLVDGSSFELMDGYTRYIVLKRHGQDTTYAYVGIPGVHRQT
jgi:hypothetical protein